MKTKPSTTLIILAITMACPALAAETGSGASQQSYAPSLGVIMTVTQLRHFKLWYAGNIRNWTLADYELNQINGSIEEAKKLYPNAPTADMSSLAVPADEIRGAIAAKDTVKFEKAFERLTSVCNSCHKATGLGFIEIVVPRISPMMTSPFSDQSFAPK
jgi:hypothetical protein